MKKLALLLLVLAAPALAQAPDEATKAAALKRAYEMNGNSMVRWGSIDLSEEDKAGQVTADAPAHAAAEVTDPNALNPLDAQAPDWEARRRFMNRTFKATRNQLAGDVCERHGMHKVVYGDKWRCRK
jgi:hypothetical protein